MSNPTRNALEIFKETKHLEDASTTAVFKALIEEIEILKGELE